MGQGEKSLDPDWGGHKIPLNHPLPLRQTLCWSPGIVALHCGSAGSTEPAANPKDSVFLALGYYSSPVSLSP